jgi:hypothetical protein
MYLFHPDVSLTLQGDRCYVEDRDVRTTFHGQSAGLCSRVVDALRTRGSIPDIAESTGYSESAIEACLKELEADGFILSLDFPRNLDPNTAIKKIRAAAVFWNKHVMSQPFPILLFGGEASRAQVLGWGLEFHFFVRAAREYMARGASRISGPTEVVSEFWDHFAEEAFHDEMFREGLVASGLTENAVKNRLPLASTMALLNHLWESAEEGELEYAAAFAVMQPVSVRPTANAITKKYDGLRAAYQYAAPLFDAFEKHEKIDVALEHSTLTLESLLRSFESVSSRDMNTILRIVRATAENFDIFFEGIAAYYKSDLSLSYRQRPNASSLAQRTSFSG